MGTVKEREARQKAKAKKPRKPSEMPGKGFPMKKTGIMTRIAKRNFKNANQAHKNITRDIK